MPREDAQADPEALRKPMAGGSGLSRMIHVKGAEESPGNLDGYDAEDPPGCRSSLPSQLEVVDIQGHWRDPRNWSGTIRFDLKSLTGSGASRVAR
jgi:hypothetical protein